MKKSEFQTMMSMVLAAYPNAKIPKPTVKVYWLRFQGVDSEAFYRATQEAIGESEYFPTIARINKFLPKPPEQEIPSEAEVMCDLYNAIRKYGFYESPRFKFPITNAVAEELGWENICNMEAEKLPDAVHFRYKPIAAHYEKCLQTGEDFPINRMKGLFERRNGLPGRSGMTHLKEALDIVSEAAIK